jgi:hypothetical protein
MSRLLPAAFRPVSDALDALLDQGHAAIAATDWCRAWGVDPSALMRLATAWDRLSPDRYLRDGGRYRRRRHACYTASSEAEAPLVDMPHRAHWQPVEYNALHGGIERWFDPIEPAVSADPAWRRVMRSLCDVATRLRGRPAVDGIWHVEAHQFRIDTTDGIGRPTPEGAHRDGVDLVAVFLVDRHQVKGGETRVFEADGPRGERFTLTEPWSLLLLDDARVIHESTPIQPMSPSTEAAWRDTLVVTCRAGGFQGPTGPR